MAESKDEDKGGHNGREELVEEEESRVAEKLVQLRHHLQRIRDMTVVGFFEDTW